jgi:flagellar biosynthesis/type III secretory pathway protein FliH
MNLDVYALISIVTLSIMLVATLGAYLNAKTKLNKIEQEGDLIREQARQHARAVLEQAQDTALKMAQEAILHAQENKNLIKQKLDEVANQEIESYRQLAKQTSETANSELKQTFKLKMDEEWIKIEHEIDAYKEARKQEINDRVSEAVKKATERLIGKAITVDTHQELILTQLDKVKSEYGF